MSESRDRFVVQCQITDCECDALKSGDYANANLEVRSSDEVGQLARTFNVMIDVLRQRERERDGRRAISIGYERDEAPSATTTERSADDLTRR